jgi:hypothetical protein
VTDDPGARGYLLDTSALAAIASSRRMSTLVTAAPHFDWPLYAPVTCLDAADRIHPGIARHVGLISAIEPLDLTYAELLDLRERAPKAGLDVAHVISLARPSPIWPGGLTVATVLPGLYHGFQLRIFPVGE